MWYELLRFIWFSNMSKLVQNQYDTNWYNSNMSKLLLDQKKYHKKLAKHVQDKLGLIPNLSSPMIAAYIDNIFKTHINASFGKHFTTELNTVAFQRLLYIATDMTNLYTAVSSLHHVSTFCLAGPSFLSSTVKTPFAKLNTSEDYLAWKNTCQILASSSMWSYCHLVETNVDGYYTFQWMSIIPYVPSYPKNK